MYIKKESIYMPISESSKVQSLNETSRTTHQTDSIKIPTLQEVRSEANPGIVDTFRSYLNSWTNAAQEINISDNLKNAVDQIKGFPANSIAFYIGVKEVLKIAKKEASELVADISGELETEGFVSSLKSLALIPLEKAANFVALFANRYLGAFGNFLMDSFKFFFGEEKKKEKSFEEAEELKPEVSKLGAYVPKNDVSNEEKTDLLGELVEKCSDFLSYSKNYFAHNILDNDDEASRFKPEVLIEGDLKSRPVFDAHPPEWVLKKMQLEEAQLSEQRSRKSTIS